MRNLQCARLTGVVGLGVSFDYLDFDGFEDGLCLYYSVMGTISFFALASRMRFLSLAVS